MARYDGIADWYDQRVGAQPGTTTVADVALALLGPGAGSLLDVGCGTGLVFAPLVEAGWRVTGLDASADQLRVAGDRARQLGIELIKGDASALPFAAASFDAACLLRVLTDVDDTTMVLREAARVVRPGGPIIVVTAHPCFIGPTVRVTADGSREVLPGYRTAGWHSSGPGIGDGIRSRVGVRHVPLAELLNALAAADLHLDTAVEPDDEPIPTLLAMRARLRTAPLG
jgi:ubiquinone/menaquinone biosynthesis C-methylase UbiE